MSNTMGNEKVCTSSSNNVAGWILLAEDAERDIAGARLRVKQLSEAARIFRRNAESGIPFPVISGIEAQNGRGVPSPR
jgi:hypothetical protein